jgi:hypothetical protein
METGSFQNVLCVVIIKKFLMKYGDRICVKCQIYVCIYVYVYMCVCVYVYIYICIYICIYIYIYMIQLYTFNLTISHYDLNGNVPPFCKKFFSLGI